ncbi:MAG TPA: ABC transporter substrate-binding protein [Candidatus Limnocylindria bacterium]
MTRTFKYIAPLAVLMLVLAACDAGDESPGPGASGDGELGGEISIIAVYADAEQEAFMSMIEPWAEEHGVQINYESTRDINAVLTTRLAGGNPPDIAGLPGPGQMAEFARNDQLVALDDVIDLDTYRENYSDAWIELGSADGEFVGIFTKNSVKGGIWYNPAAFEDAGYEVPEDFAGLEALVEQIAEDGTPPWGIGLENAAASGWPGTDWIEDFMLRQSGPDAYNQWWQGELAWTSDEVRSAFEAFGAWAADETYVAGGPNSALNTAFGNGGDCLFEDPPECYLHHQASFITSFFEDNFPDVAESGVTYDFFMMPGIEYDGVVAGGDLFGMFNDTPQARSLMQYLVTPEAQQIWVEIGGALSPNKGVSLDAYPDEISRRSAEALINAETVVFDASDLMPTEMNAAFWSAVLDYVQNPDNLDSILENLDAVQEDSYGG